MRDKIKERIARLKNMLDYVVSTDADANEYELDEAIEKALSHIMSIADNKGKLMLIGNGASASIASHIAVDFWKNAEIPAISFNDSALLTCIGNDYGYENVFKKPIEKFAEKKDLLIAISSSGKSENIIKAVKAAKNKGAIVLTLSGFKKDNPLRKLGVVNFYVPVNEYGYVEVIHHFICHCLVDMLSKEKNG
jgi:D-sedoheptulose 7-phosphate isomerase